MKIFVCGDIHGAYRALVDVLTKANFNFLEDSLIVLGDACDGWSETPETIELLLTIKNLIYIRGNHDIWSAQFINTDIQKTYSLSKEYGMWLMHGGQATLDAYNRLPELKNKHIEFLNNSKLYYIDDKNRLFIHAGYKPNYVPGIHHNINEKNNYPYLEDNFLWDRDFWYFAYIGRNVGKDFNEVYIGHTPTLNYSKNNGEHLKPMKRGNVYNMDTGAAFTGKLSIMNIDTKELFQSEKVNLYYPEEKGRNK
jgi:serine/threonine protein phosphatase 1